MKSSRWPMVLALAALSSPFGVVAAAQNEPPRDYYRLALQNEYISLHQMNLPPNGSTPPIRRDYESIDIAIGDAQIIDQIRGEHQTASKPIKDAQIEFLPPGDVHVVSNDGKTAFREDTVELLGQQGTVWNLCGRPLPHVAVKPGTVCWGSDHPPLTAATSEFETDETRLTSGYLGPNAFLSLSPLPAPAGNMMTMAEFNLRMSRIGFDPDPERDRLILVLDESVIESGQNQKQRTTLQPGDFIWINHGDLAPTLKNTSMKSARFIMIEFKPLDP